MLNIFSERKTTILKYYPFVMCLTDLWIICCYYVYKEVTHFTKLGRLKCGGHLEIVKQLIEYGNYALKVNQHSFLDKKEKEAEGHLKCFIEMI